MTFDTTSTRLPSPEVGEVSPGSHPTVPNRPTPTPPFSSPHIHRFSVFLLLEAGFVALAWYCYARPRQLPESLGFRDTTVKSGFIVVFSIWHTIAVTSAFNICADTFSREWAARPGQDTDVVSTITTGFIDHVSYSFRSGGRATKTYRTAFFSFLGLLLMRTIGPSAITVSSGIEFSQELSVGLISATSLTQNLTDLESQNSFSRLAQASMVVRLEQLIGVPWGYKPQLNWLIPLPNEDVLQSISKVVYTTDLVYFNHTCNWQAPSISRGNGEVIFKINNESWSWRFLRTPSQETLNESRTSRSFTIT